MGKATLFLTSIVMLALGAWQCLRVNNYGKDIVYHHNSQCKQLSNDMPVVDMTSCGEAVIGLSDEVVEIASKGLQGQNQGQLFTVYDLKSDTPSLRKETIANFPAGVNFHPRGMYLHLNTTLYIINNLYAKETTRIEVLDVEDNKAGGLAFNYKGHIGIPEDMQGRTRDLMLSEDGDIYLSQYSPFPDMGDGGYVNRAMNFLYDFFRVEATSVKHCKANLNEVAICSSLEQTQAVSSTSISRNKFGDYYISFSSIDYNWVGVYDRNEEGELTEKQRIYVRDKVEKIDWDEGWQRTYGGALPYTCSCCREKLTPGGIIEINTWDFRSYYAHRRLVMQDGGLQKGASCAARQKNTLLVGSLHDSNLLVCPIVSPTN